MKKLVSLVLALGLVIACIPAMALETDDVFGGYTDSNRGHWSPPWDHSEWKEMIRFELKQDASISAEAYDSEGNLFKSLIVDQDYSAGDVIVNWPAVNDDGWHPGNGVTADYDVVVTAVIDGETYTITYPYTITFSHDISDHYSQNIMWYPHNTVCVGGLEFRQEKPEVTNKWYNFAPIDLNIQGEQVYELVASNTSKDLDILITPAKRKVSGTIVAKTKNNKAIDIDFDEDPLMLIYTDRAGNETIYPADDQTPIGMVPKKGIRYSVELFPGNYTIRAFGANSGNYYSFNVKGEAGDESVIVPIEEDVKDKDLVLLAGNQDYVGTWVDEITYQSPFGVSGGTKMTLELGKMMNATWTMEAIADYSGMYGWSKTGYPHGSHETEAYQGSWLEVDNGIVFYLNGDTSVPIYFDMVKRNTLKLNLNKLEALASGSSEEGLMMVAVLEVFKIAMSMDIGNLFGMNFGVSMNDMIGISSTDDLLYFTKQK